MEHCMEHAKTLSQIREQVINKQTRLFRGK